jgi:hypothetical protein
VEILGGSLFINRNGGKRMQKYGAAIIMAIALVTGIIYLSTTGDILLWGDFGLIALLSVA